MKTREYCVSGVNVILNDLSANPRCLHGPTILFERFLKNRKPKRFYACSASRDRKGCPFFHWAHVPLSRAKAKYWDDIIQRNLPKCTHLEEYRRLKKIRRMPPNDRACCNTCSQLVLPEEADQHKACELWKHLSDANLNFPSTYLPLRENPKLQAQFMFQSRSIEVLLGFIKGLFVKSLLCIGTPRIHEEVAHSPNSEIKSLLLDIDNRYRSFFGPEEFVQYNMFNHHFFEGETAKNTYKAFISNSTGVAVVMDPPFGGRIEILAYTLKLIEEDWRELNKLDSTRTLPVMLIFPYFNEKDVLAVLPSFSMLDYQVDYENHPLYCKGKKGMKNGSAVRVYVNRSPSLFSLCELEGYKFCKECDRWVMQTNAHCFICKGCMSKDGRTYIHCDDCNMCVKPMWVHCQSCGRCQPEKHRCQSGPDIKNLMCLRCQCGGHRRKDCTKRKNVESDSKAVSKAGKKKKLKKFPLSVEDEKKQFLDIASHILNKLHK